VVVIEIPPEANTERAHLHALAVQLRLQALVNADTVMTLPDKLRASCAIAQAMSKLSVQAELERRIECLERERAAEADILVAERQKVEIERRRVDAERAELNERWAQLRKQLAGVQN
jgi:multidrug efflux pump subunit AcrA (membrane-fusion protein)